MKQIQDYIKNKLDMKLNKLKENELLKIKTKKMEFETLRNGVKDSHDLTIYQTNLNQWEESTYSAYKLDLKAKKLLQLAEEPNANNQDWYNAYITALEYDKKLQETLVLKLHTLFPIKWINQLRLLQCIFLVLHLAAVANFIYQFTSNLKMVLHHHAAGVFVLHTVTILFNLALKQTLPYAEQWIRILGPDVSADNVLKLAQEKDSDLALSIVATKNTFFKNETSFKNEYIFSENKLDQRRLKID